MTRIAIAEGIKNELERSDLLAIERLLQGGCEVQLIYYLPKVPAEFTAIPSVNEQLRRWRSDGLRKLNKLGDQLNIPTENRRFVDEILGPDEVFDEAKQFKAEVILTKNRDDLKPSFLGRLADFIKNRGDVEQSMPIETVAHFVDTQLKSINENKEGISPRTRAVNDDQKIHALWTKQPRSGESSPFTSKKTEKKPEEVTQENKRRYNR